jgi:hypothetical protein
MQSFFPHPLRQWFQVRLDDDIQDSSRMSMDSMQREIAQALSATKQGWQSQFEMIDTMELHADQTPPWLLTTGISSFLARLQQEKKEILGLRSSPVLLGKLYLRTYMQ